MLHPEDEFLPDIAALERELASGEHDLAILVNPNSPTGRHVSKEAMEQLLRKTAARARVWVDETYIDYAGPDASLESFAAQSANVLVCKSMSKVYALSGARVAYLAGPQAILAELLAITPPWVVGLPSQLAAVRALQSPAYYQQRYAETHALRARLAKDLQALGLRVTPGCANFLLCVLPEGSPTAAEVVAYGQTEGIFIRDAALMGAQLGPQALRIAVKRQEENDRIIQMLGRAILRGEAPLALKFEQDLG